MDRSVIMSSPYELLDEVRNTPQPPSLDKMCRAIARSDAAKVGLSDMRIFYREERTKHLYRYKKLKIEQLYAALSPRYKAQT